MISEGIINVLKAVKEDNLDNIPFEASTNIIEAIGLDSLQMINFVLKLEDEFGMAEVSSF